MKRLAGLAWCLFDRVPARLAGVTVVGVLAGLTGVVGWLQSAFLEKDCAPLQISLVRLEVTFSMSRFATLLRAAGTSSGLRLRLQDSRVVGTSRSV